jgi:hypothetical protein
MKCSEVRIQVNDCFSRCLDFSFSKSVIIIITIIIITITLPIPVAARFAAVRLLGLLVRIPPGAWMSASCECCVLSRTGHCSGLIIRPEGPTEMSCVLIVMVKLV